MIKVVPDANIILSGFLSHQGNPRRLINLALSKRVILYGSEETYKEFIEKINMPKFKKYIQRQLFTPEKLIMDYRTFINMVEPHESIKIKGIVKEDPDDDVYFWTAKACKASILVSGDKAVLKVKKYENIRVINIETFIRLFSKTNSL